jgi:hypothetical protein
MPWASSAPRGDEDFRSPEQLQGRRMEMIVMAVRDVYVIDAPIAHPFDVGRRVRPPLRTEAGPVSPRVRDDAQPVSLDQEAGMPDERDPHLHQSPSGCGHGFLNHSHGSLLLPCFARQLAREMFLQSPSRARLD